MSERERLSEEAYERKKEYNREYRKKYINDNNLVVFSVDLEANFNRDLINLLAINNMTRKDFIVWAYDKLNQEG